jgi:hypothetical protein
MEGKVIELPKRFQQGAVVVQQCEHLNPMVRWVAPSSPWGKRSPADPVPPTPCQGGAQRSVPTPRVRSSMAHRLVREKPVRPTAGRATRSTRPKGVRGRAQGGRRRRHADARFDLELPLSGRRAPWSRHRAPGLSKSARRRTRPLTLLNHAGPDISCGREARQCPSRAPTAHRPGCGLPARPRPGVCRPRRTSA